MSKYKTFIFKAYEFDREAGKLDLHYSYDDTLDFMESFVFDFDFTHFETEVLDRALQNLFFMAGVSYFKAYLAPAIEIRSGEIDTLSAKFYAEVYQKGLGEFFYINKLDPKTSIAFPITTKKPLEKNTTHTGDGLLVGIGGGKDSLVSVDILRDRPEFSTWSVGHKKQLTPLIRTINPPNHYWVERSWDKKLLELNEQDALNGHIPISAILAAVGTVVTVLSGKRDVVVSNEASASEATLEYQGASVNHQYSKSLEFEILYQAHLDRLFGSSVRYYSLLRPFSELYIAELFSKNGLEEYRSVFTSCNRAFTHGTSEISWCGSCAKCAFVFLLLTPFVERKILEKLYGDNLLLNPKLHDTYAQLLGISGEKPLDCVGEIKESRAAMDMAKKVYGSELDSFIYELPDDYNYRARRSHSIPPEIFKLLPH